MKNSQKGFVVLFITFFILIIMLTIAMSMGSLTFYRSSMAANQIKSTQSYYAAESGAEDALLRLKNNPSLSSASYNITVNTATTAVVIPAAVGGSRTITSQGALTNRNRKIQVVYSMDGDAPGFNYGAQIGDGGITMNSNSVIDGNIVSSGSVSGASGSEIIGDVVIAGANHTLSNVDVTGNVLAYGCSNSDISGDLIYISPGGSSNCSVGRGTSTQSEAITTEALPISEEEIDGFKADATAGGTTSGSVNYSSNQTVSLGPRRITGNLTLGSNVTLTITGTVYVVGNINIGSNSVVKLASSYGSLGGILVADGTIVLNSNVDLRGSGQAGSYLLAISTNTVDTAINIGSGAEGGVFFTSAGGITLNSNTTVKGLTGYRLILGSNAEISYETGLANAFFSNGASAGWSVSSWVEQ